MPARVPRWHRNGGGAFFTPFRRRLTQRCCKEIVMQVVEAHGARIPTIGLGTMTLKEDVCVQAVKTALQIRYRHLGQAAFYGNETENGEGLRQSGIKREE